MSQAKSVKQVLQAAEWIIQNVGWSQFANFRDKNGQVAGYVSKLSDSDYANLGSVCLNGAVQLVKANYALKLKALVLLDAAAGKGCGFSSITAFNDLSSTTKNKVLSMIRRVIQEIDEVD